MRSRLCLLPEKLIECLRMNSSPGVQSQILLCFRVLLLRMSHHHLTSLWPFIYTEMVSLHAFAFVMSRAKYFFNSFKRSSKLKWSCHPIQWNSSECLLGISLVLSQLLMLPLFLYLFPLIYIALLAFSCLTCHWPCLPDSLRRSHSGYATDYCQHVPLVAYIFVGYL